MQINQEEVALVANAIGIQKGDLPIHYLGLPIGVNMRICKNWKPVVDTFQRRLSKWSARSLSIGGRPTLINTVLSSIPLYFFSLFRAPQKILHQLEKLRRNNLWSGKQESNSINWVAWSKVILPKDQGGLGIRSLEAANLTLLAKWWWRYKLQATSLWHKIVSSIHSHSNAGFLPIRSGIEGIWKSIYGIKDNLANHGYNLIDNINGEFDAKEIKKCIDNQGTTGEELVFKWNSWIPKKVNVMNWRANLNRLPTLQALHTRGITLQSDICLFCNESTETIDHLLTSCPFSLRLWNKIGSWCRINPIYAFSSNDIYQLHVFKPGSNNWKKLINAIVLVTCWSFWRARNDRLHNNKKRSEDQILNEVKAMSFLWIGNRAMKFTATWEQWNSFSVTL